MSRGSRAHGERDELLLTGSITFLNFTLYGFMVSPSGGPASCER